MSYEGYQCLKFHIDRRVAFVTIDHPPINLFDVNLMKEMNRLSKELEADDNIGVAVFQSANPDFFIAHAAFIMPRAAGTFRSRVKLF